MNKAKTEQKAELDTIFLKRYKSLNNEQKRAVDTLEGPVLVVAGPGTGKTTILTLRIANILRTTDTPPSGILAITYTDAGVKAMKTKLRELIGSRADEVRIHTFHGFAASLINEFKDHFVRISSSRQMTDIDAESVVRSILAVEEFADLRPFGNPDFYIRPILEGIRDSKRESLSSEMIQTYAEDFIKKIENDSESISSRGETKGQLKAQAKKDIEKAEKTKLFAKVYAQYEEVKKEKSLIDFDDLIFELLLNLGRDELFLRLVQEKFLYILIDEHQDTNDSQNNIIKMIADFFPNPNVFIVGDEKQAIYRFQGASVKNFLSFEKRWPSMTVISLKENYRSHQDILDASFHMIEKNYMEGEHEKLRIKLTAGNGSKAKPIEIIQGQTIDASEQYLLEQLARISNEQPEKTVALISKTNRDVERLIRICQDAGIAVSAERSIDIFSHPVGLMFFALIQCVVDPSNTEALGKTVVGRLWNLSFAQSASLLRKIRSGKLDEIEESLPGLMEARKALNNDSTIRALMYVVAVSGLLNIIAKEPGYVEVWRALLGLGEFLSRQEHIQDPATLFEKLLAYKTSAEMKSVKVHVGVPDARIHVMTAHGSKGLEYDYVFIPYANDESWSTRSRSSYFVFPFEKEMEEGDEIRDARRLFYVSITRAKEHVSIIYSLERSGGELLTPLRFLDELDEKSVTKISIGENIGQNTAKNADQNAGDNADLTRKRNLSLLSPSKKITHDEEIIQYAKHTLLEYGLSVTALNHYLKCPSEFIYKSILKLPEAPHPSAEKGIAMHAACDLIWKATDKSPANIEKIIKETVKKKLDESFLVAYEKEIIEKELFEHAPMIAKSLSEHFKISGTVATEFWTQSSFTGEVQSEKIEIPIHGKLDALVDTGSQVFVFDYKTRGKLSVNQIKGLTKNSDGGYFRQLVFYKYLLQDQSLYKGKDILPALVFLTPDEKGNCHVQALPIEQQDIEVVKGEIQKLLDDVWSGEIMKASCNEEKCEWCNLKKMLHI